ncbi:MAG TPA: response regulator [Polyangia bacterium]|nr:response regulator [Polyangia bacterium]
MVDVAGGVLILVCGPPLPGRWQLARALTARLGARRFLWQALPSESAIGEALAGGECVLIDGDLPTAAERRALVAAHPSATPLIVAWSCTRDQAEREIFHRYAARPRCLAELELERYLDDARLREHVATELDGESLVMVGAGMPLADQLLRVVSAIAPRPFAAEPAPRRPGVLVVEDDPEERAVLAEVLTELGYDIELAPDAGVALALLDDGAPIELVLSDQRMPGLTGVELVRELADRFPHVRAVLLTGHSDDLTCADALGAHAVSVLSKPVHVIDLARVLDEASGAGEFSS